MKAFMLFVLLLVCYDVPAQNAEWKYVRPTNMGIMGNYVYSIAFENNGNMWIAGDDPVWDEGGASVYNGAYWKTYSNVDGNMISHEVHKIFIDSRGDKWFSTDNGLMRLSGDVKTVFNNSNSPFPSNHISDITEDKLGNIWIGIGSFALNIPGGIGKYDGISWTIHTNLYPGINTNTANKLFFDDNGLLWVGWDIGGLMTFDGAIWTLIPPTFNTYRGGETSGIIQDSTGNLWFTTTTNGFGRLSGTTWSWWNRNTVPELGTDGFSGVILAGYNSVYVSTYTGAVFKFDGSILDRNDWEGSHIYDLTFGPDGGLWVCGIGGVQKLIGQNPVNYNVQNTSLPSRAISYINVDADNNKWFCTRGGGLAQFDDVKWRDFNPYNFNSEPWPFPTSIASQVIFDRLGNTWVGADGGGVGLWNGNNWTTYEAGLTANWVLSVGIDSAQTIWAGLFNWGVGKLNRSTGVFTMYDVSNSQLPNNYVYAFAANEDSSIWIGTGSGLARYKNDNWIIYRTDNSGIPNNRVTDLKKDPSGNLWVGTANGLAKFDGTNWTIYNVQNSNIPASYITGIAISNSGIVWIGCYQGSTFPYTGGVAKFDGNIWTSWTSDNSSLPSDQVESIALDKLDNLWIGTAIMGVAVFKEGGIVTGTGNSISNINIPEGYILKQNYPNPFNPVTVISYSLIGNGLVTLKVYDVLGKVVSSLVNEKQNAGVYSVEFDASNYSSGVYFYSLTSQGFTETKRMILLK